MIRGCRCRARHRRAHDDFNVELATFKVNAVARSGTACEDDAFAILHASKWFVFKLRGILIYSVTFSKCNIALGWKRCFRNSPLARQGEREPTAMLAVPTSPERNAVVRLKTRGIVDALQRDLLSSICKRHCNSTH